MKIRKRRTSLVPLIVQCLVRILTACVLFLLLVCQTVPEGQADASLNTASGLQDSNSGISLYSQAGSGGNIWDFLDRSLVENTVFIALGAIALLLILTALVSAARRAKKRRK